MWIASSFFIFSIAGIIGLFSLKEWESRRNLILAPRLREKMDRLSFCLKELLFALRADIEKLPPEILRLSHILLHEMALGIARTLRFLSHQTHRFANLLSHRHAFRRQAPRSEFLKKVIEHKNGIDKNDKITLE